MLDVSSGLLADLSPQQLVSLQLSEDRTGALALLCKHCFRCETAGLHEKTEIGGSLLTPYYATTCELFCYG